MNKKILVIDDDNGDLIIINTILASMGFSVDMCYDAAFGIELAERNDYAMIIVDFFMPRYTGLEIKKKIKDQRDAPFFIMSGESYERLKDKLNEGGVPENNYIGKDSLMNNIRKAVVCAGL